MHTVRTAIAVMGNYGEHPDENWNRTAYPVIENILVGNIVGENITQAGLLLGLPDAPFHDIHLTKVVLDTRTTKQGPWNCSWVTGFYNFVLPKPCPELTMENSNG